MKKELPIVAPEGYEIDKERMVFISKEIDLFPDESWYDKNRWEKNEITLLPLKNKIVGKIKAFTKLIELRDEVNRRDGFVVDWNDKNQIKNCIVIKFGEIRFDCYYIKQEVLAFRTIEISEQFAEKYKHLIDQCSDLL